MYQSLFGRLLIIFMLGLTISSNTKSFPTKSGKPQYQSKAVQINYLDGPPIFNNQIPSFSLVKLFVIKVLLE